MLMAPEDNSDPSQVTVPNSDEAGRQPAAQQNFIEPSVPTTQGAILNPPVSQDPTTPVGLPVITNPAPTQSEVAPNNVPTIPDKPTPAKRSHLKSMLVVLLIVVLFGASITAAYYVGKHKRIVVPVATTQPINLPPTAVVIADCTPGRGKQYIIPKDIPVGPIYDVKNSKVIAIEYVIGIKALLSNPDTFSNTLLLLTQNYPVDHFTIVPEPPKPTDTDQFIHLIMFIVSKAEANSITCGASSGAGASSTSTTPPTSSTTQ